jgi:hypothetical protein
MHRKVNISNDMKPTVKGVLLLLHLWKTMSMVAKTEGLLL